MSDGGLALIATGLGLVGVTAWMSWINSRAWPMNPKASQERIELARRYEREMRTIVIPWAYRIGVGIIIVGAALVLWSVVTD